MVHLGQKFRGFQQVGNPTVPWKKLIAKGCQETRDGVYEQFLAHQTTITCPGLWVISNGGSYFL
jgi:hypothetical protein